MKPTSILELDARLSNQMRVAEKPGALRAIAVFFAHSGDSWFWAIGLFALWLSGDSFWKEWAVVQLAGISLLAVLVLLIKFRVRRSRPEGEWGSIYRNTDPHSFPSGHTSLAAVADTLSARNLESTAMSNGARTAAAVSLDALTLATGSASILPAAT